MSEHKWLTAAKLSTLRRCAEAGKGGDFMADPLTDDDGLNLLDDLAAAKALLRECTSCIQYWNERLTDGEIHIAADLRALLARIRAVPGVEETSDQDEEG